MTSEEFEAIWARAIAKEEEDRAAWEALPEEEKKRLNEMFDEGFRARMTENPLGDDD